MQVNNRARFAAAVMIASACSPLIPSRIAAAKPPSPQPGSAAGRITPVPCPVAPATALARTVECFEFAIPIDRRGPRAGDGAMAFAIVRARQPDPARPTLLFLMGGNGAGVKLIMRQPVLLRDLSKSRDVILVDHRGAGFSRPGVNCPTLKNAVDVSQASVADLRACAASHRASGIDVNLFGPAAAAADIRDLRLALGMHRWDLYAISYGTRMAKSLLELDGAAVRSAVLDGIYGWNSNVWSRGDRLDPVIRLLDGCSSDPSCNTAFPDLENHLAQLLTRLRAQPARVNGHSVSATDFMNGIQGALEAADARRQIPLAIYRAGRGQFDVWSELAASDQDGDGPPGRDPSLTFYGQACREEFLLRKRTRLFPPPQRPLPDVIATSLEITWAGTLDKGCDLLGYTPATPAELAVQPISVPTLMLNGEIDMHTPLHGAERAQRHFSDVRAITFPLTGHWVLRGEHDCALPIVEAFYSNPQSSPDTACVDSMPRMQWATVRTEPVRWPAEALTGVATELHGVDIAPVEYAGSQALRVRHLTGEDGRSLALLPGTSFQDGTIDVDVAGDIESDAVEGARGFVGIAFRVQPGAGSYEAFYLRPYNGRAQNQEQRNHSAQYISMPEHPWHELRGAAPGRYETYVDLVPGAWTHMRIVVSGATASLFVGGAAEPVLLVSDLKHGVSTGALALWIDASTVAHFAHLTVSPE